MIAQKIAGDRVALEADDCSSELTRIFVTPRGRIFHKLKIILAELEKADPFTGVHRTVWESKRITPESSSVSYDAFSDACLMEKRLGEHVIRYSIAVRIGEVRIGVIIPDTLDMDGYSLDAAVKSFPYDSGKSVYPDKLVRNLDGSGVLVDHIYANIRFAEQGLTIRALGGENEAINLVADGIIHDLLHISWSVASALFKTGLIIAEEHINSIKDIDESFTLRVKTKLNRSDLIDYLSIEPSRIFNKEADDTSDQEGFFCYIVVLNKQNTEENHNLKKKVDWLNRQAEEGYE